MTVVRYLVSDVQNAADFYTKQLGFKQGRSWGKPFASLSLGDLELWLSGPESSASRPMPNGDSPRSGGWNRLVIQVEDLPATVEQMKAAGVRFRNEIVTGPGGKQILAEDPSGNPVELFQPA